MSNSYALCTVQTGRQYRHGLAAIVTKQQNVLAIWRRHRIRAQTVGWVDVMTCHDGFRHGIELVHANRVGQAAFAGSTADARNIGTNGGPRRNVDWLWLGWSTKAATRGGVGRAIRGSTRAADPGTYKNVHVPGGIRHVARSVGQGQVVSSHDDSIGQVDLYQKGIGRRSRVCRSAQRGMEHQAAGRKAVHSKIDATRLGWSKRIGRENIQFARVTVYHHFLTGRVIIQIHGDSTGFHVPDMLGRVNVKGFNLIDSSSATGPHEAVPIRRQFKELARIDSFRFLGVFIGHVEGLAHGGLERLFQHVALRIEYNEAFGTKVPHGRPQDALGVIVDGIARMDLG